MELRLKSCPFCGAKPHYRTNGQNGIEVADFEHEEDCYFSSIGFECDSVSEVGSCYEWNRRYAVQGFVWHLMKEEKPEPGKGKYIVMGVKGGLYLAPRFVVHDDGMWFKDTRGEYHYTEQVKAWAKIPRLEVQG